MDEDQYPTQGDNMENKIVKRAWLIQFDLLEGHPIAEKQVSNAIDAMLKAFYDSPKTTPAILCADFNFDFEDDITDHQLYCQDEIEDAIKAPREVKNE